MRLFRYLLIAVSIFGTHATAMSEEHDRLHLASLEWAPYVSQLMPDEGLVSAIVKAAAKESQLPVTISYFPWSRAVQAGLDEEDFAGYFPAFYLKEREKTCYFSNSLGNSTVGFASLKDAHFDWQNLLDLHAYKIGLVHDYANGEAFDALVKKHVLRTDSAPSDISNLRKLLAGRVDVIVIDKNVLRQLLITDSSLGKEKQNIIFHPKELTNFTMHICFQRNPRGLRLQKAFNAGLNSVKIKQFENQYFAQLPAVNVPGSVPGSVPGNMAH